MRSGSAIWRRLCAVNWRGGCGKLIATSEPVIFTADSGWHAECRWFTVKLRFAPIAVGTDAGVPSAYANADARSLESNTLT